MGKLTDENPYEVFLPEEQRILDKTLTLREQIIDKIVEEKGIPTDSRTVRVMNEVLNAMDSQVLGRVDRRQKQEENQNNEEAKELIKEILLRVNTAKKEVDTTNLPRKEVDRTLDVGELVPGEDVIEYEQLSLEDIMKNVGG